MPVLFFLINPCCEQGCSRNRCPRRCPIYIYSRQKCGSVREGSFRHTDSVCRDWTVSLRIRDQASGPITTRPGPPGGIAVPVPSPNQTVYVLDQGLVRFAKFTGGVLAIFVTVGLFLYGVDVKQVAKDVRSEADRIRQIREDASKLLEDTQASLSQLGSKPNSPRRLKAK